MITLFYLAFALFLIVGLLIQILYEPVSDLKFTVQRYLEQRKLGFPAEKRYQEKLLAEKKKQINDKRNWFKSVFGYDVTEEQAKTLTREFFKSNDSKYKEMRELAKQKKLFN